MYSNTRTVPLYLVAEYAKLYQINGDYKMNKKVLKTLYFNKIIDLLKEEAGSDIGSQTLCENLTPSSDYHEIKIMQQNTGDALTRVWQKGESFFGTSQHW